MLDTHVPVATNGPKAVPASVRISYNSTDTGLSGERGSFREGPGFTEYNAGGDTAIKITALE